MKIIKKNQVILYLIMSVIISFFAFQINVTRAKTDNSVAEIVMEVNTNRILYQNNINTKKYMASTTKILTAICVIENCDINEIVTVGKETTGIEGSSIYLEEGEKLTVKDLLYGLMLRSGNDCAETLAVFCSDTIDKFAALMNQTAERIGAKNSHFVNPHGLHDDNHYTTAYDLALISCYAIKNPVFKEIVSTKYVKIPFTTKDTFRFLKNKNKMLFQYEGANGIKTGYTKKAGRCLVSSAEKNGLELVCVVLNCPPMFERSQELFTSKFNEYIPYKVLESDNIIDFYHYKDKEIPIEISEDLIIPLKKDEINDVFYEIVYDKDLSNKKIGDKIGEIKIFLSKNLIFSRNIFTIIDID